MKTAKRNRPFRHTAMRLTLAVQQASTTQRPVPAAAQLQRWAEAALQPGLPAAEVTLRIVDAEEGRTLNRDYRGKDYATNVLTFALHEGEAIPGMPLFGDIVLTAVVVEREADEQGIALDAHYAHLVVHGMLHLQGFDHEEDDEAEDMEALETAILGRLGYPDPYLAEKERDRTGE